MPHLQRDEPEIVVWMFYNAWCSCYREEINAMIEHPSPVLGYSNAAHFKTSDEANAVMWLRTMFVYADEQLLHFGRAIPREWFRSGKPFGTEGVCTRFGRVSVWYQPSADGSHITAEAHLDIRSAPQKTLVRFRHPEGLPLKTVQVNGEPTQRLDPERNDVDITGLSGRIVLHANF
jgi:hypothetical protein